MPKSKLKLGPLDAVLLQQFPDDELLREITAIGPARRVENGDNKVEWDVVLKPRVTDDTLVQSVAVRVRQGYFRHLRLASSWQGNMPNELDGGYKATRKITVDGSSQKILVRMPQEGPEAVFTPAGSNTQGPRYVMMPVVGDDEVQYCLIRCTEIFRKYFSSVPALNRYMFDFTEDNQSNAENFHLFRPAPATRKIDENTFQIYRQPKVSLADAGAIGMFLHLDPFRESLLKFAQTARTQSGSGQAVWPTMPAPIDQPVKWTVLGGTKLVEIGPNKGARPLHKVFGIAQLLASSDATPLPEVIVEYDGFEDDVREKKLIIPVKQSQVSDEVPSLVAHAAPGNDATVEQHEAMMADLFDGSSQLKITARPVKKKERRRAEPRTNRDKDVINEFAEQGYGRTDEDVGGYDSQPDVGDSAQAEAGPSTQMDEIDYDLARLIPCVTVRTSIPLEFRSMINNLRVLTDAGKLANYNLYGFSEEIIDPYLSSFELLHLPVEWGAEALSNNNNVGVRRLLCLKLIAKKTGMVLLDLEKKNESGSSRAQIYGFNAHARDFAGLSRLSHLAYQYLTTKRWQKYRYEDTGIVSVPLNHCSIEAWDGNPDEGMIPRIKKKLEAMKTIIEASG